MSAPPQVPHDPDRITRVLNTDAARIGAELVRRDGGTDPFAASVRATRMPMVVSDPRQPDNPIVFVNDSFCRLTGYSREEIVGRNCRFLQGPETDPAHVARLRQAVRDQVPIEMDIRNHRKDGTPFWNRLLMAPVRDVAGKVAYFFASQVDVTLERERVEGLETQNAALMAELGDRLRAQELSEERLRLSEASLRLATEAAEIGTWDLNLDTDVPGGVLTWSDRTKRMFGIPPDEPCSMDDFYSGLHPDDRHATTEAFAAAVDPARRLQYDVEYRTIGKRDGIVRWVAAKGRGLFADERCVRAVGTAIDITGRRAAEARQGMLLQLSAQLRTMTDARATVSAALAGLGRHLAADRVGLGLVQPDGVTIHLETGWAAGLPELSGPFLLDSFGPANIALMKAGRTLALADAAVPDQAGVDWVAVGVGAVVSVPLVRDGRLVASLFVNQAKPCRWMPDEVGLVEDVAALLWDAVERARAETALRELNATLEARVEERTAELRRAEDALRQAQKMEAVGQLTGGIAHDFNNLLTGITGALELLQRRVGEGRYADLGRFASVATTSANRAAALTQRLLAFARRQPLDPKPVAANRLVADMEDLLRRTLGPNIALEMVLSGGLWGTLCDPNQLESALLNLAINARDAMPEGGRLTIETANAHLDDAYARAQGFEVRTGQYVSISVTDTGVGMEQAVAGRIFEPFFTTKPIGQGTGLGLSMLYGFVKQSDGHVRVYSEPGRGTTMRLYLPRHAGAAVLEGEPDAPAVPAGAGETVLVVDDEDAVRMLVAEALADMGYVALEAADGAAGLDILRSVAKVDLLVTDVGLPGLNGRQLADAARVLRPGLRVLFITGYAGNAAIGNGVLDAGMEILTKPFALEALATKLRMMMQK